MRKYTSFQLDLIRQAAFAQSDCYEHTQYDKLGVQWTIYKNDHRNILAIKGSDLSEMEDILANIGYSPLDLAQFGAVHSGYWHQANVIAQWLDKTDIKVDAVCGHSLGGAVATILGHIRSVPVVTFGSPRCLCPDAAELFNGTLECYRFTLRGDKIPYMVPRFVPLRWWGWIPYWWCRYKHVGEHIKVGERKSVWNHAHKTYRADVEDWVDQQVPCNA